jgi:hypothetical protein
MAANERLIRDCIRAWSRLDAAELASYFTEDGCRLAPIQCPNPRSAIAE